VKPVGNREPWDPFRARSCTTNSQDQVKLGSINELLTFGFLRYSHFEGFNLLLTIGFLLSQRQLVEKFDERLNWRFPHL